MKNLRFAFFFPVILGFLVAARPAVAEISGYSIKIDTGVVTSFSCDEDSDFDCYYPQSAELGTIDIERPYATALAPTGELVVVDGHGQYPNYEQELVWFELPSLERRSSLLLDSAISGLDDITFGPGSSLWAISNSRLYEIDPISGGAIEVYELSEASGTTLALVGSRVYFANSIGYLYEFDPVTGAQRLVADYNGPWGGRTILNSLCSLGDSLWSINFSVGSPQPGNVDYWLGTHNLQTGDIETEWGFDVDAYIGSGFTLDLVNTPEQQTAGIPTLGRFGLAMIVVLIGFAGVLLVRRVS